MAIGFTITLDILAGGPLNAGPLAGAAAAALLYDRLYLHPPRPVPIGPAETGIGEPRPGHAAAD